MSASPRRRLNFGNAPAHPTLVQLRVLLALKQNMNNAYSILSNARNDNSNSNMNENNLLIVRKLQHEANRRANKYYSFIRKIGLNENFLGPHIVGNDFVLKRKIKTLEQEKAKKIISKHAPTFLNQARKHHIKWIQNLVKAKISVEELNKAIHHKTKRNIYRTRAYIPSQPAINFSFTSKSPNQLRYEEIRRGERRAIARRQAQHGPAINRITWSRRPNGKINLHKTFSNLEFNLTNVQKNALLSMPENQAVNALRRLARGEPSKRSHKQPTPRRWNSRPL